MPRSRRPIVQALHCAAGRADGDLPCSNLRALTTAFLQDALGRPPATPRARCAIDACRFRRQPRQRNPLAAAVFHVEHRRYHRRASEVQDDFIEDGAHTAERVRIPQGAGQPPRRSQMPPRATRCKQTVRDRACRSDAWDIDRHDRDQRRRDAPWGLQARRRPGTWGSRRSRDAPPARAPVGSEGTAALRQSGPRADVPRGTSDRCRAGRPRRAPRGADQFPARRTDGRSARPVPCAPAPAGTMSGARSISDRLRRLAAA